MKLSPTNELILGIVIIAVLVAAAVGFLIVPQYFAIMDTRAKIDQADKDIQAAQNLLTMRQSAKNKAAATQAELMSLQNMIPDDPQLPTLIIGLQDIANAAGVDFVRVAPDPPAAKDGYSAIPVTVSIKGSWTDTIDYMTRLEKMERQVRVTDLAIKSASQSGASAGASGSSASAADPAGTLSTDIKIEAYVLGALGTGSSTPPSSSAATSSATSKP